jgi:hypothetical protein
VKRKAFTHLAAAALGVVLAGAFSSGTKTGSSPGGEVAPGSKPPAETKTERPGALKPVAADFRRAWDAVAAKELPILERRSLQHDLLARWAQVDLEGALAAAMAEAWDNDYNPGFEILGSSGNPLITAFAQAFADRPLEAWALIQSGKFGPGAAIIRRQWVTTVGSRDPALLASMLGELPPSLQQFAVSQAVNEASANPGTLDAVLDRLAAYPPGEATDRWLSWIASSLPGDGDPAAFRDQALSLADGPARAVALAKWAASLRGAGDDKFAEEAGLVPDEAKEEAARAVMQALRPDSKSMLGAFDFAMDAGQWPLVAAEAPELLRRAPNSTDAARLADWAMDLPERPETVEIFHRAVDRYIGEDLGRAREWIAGMDEADWHRDRALAEFSQQALRRHQDPASSRWALDQIADPSLKATAEGWRRDWERERSGGP